MSALEILWSRVKAHRLSRVGPGLITGVADDDPSGIATYSQAGGQFGLNMLWTMPLAFSRSLGRGRIAHGVTAVHA
jgi:Mn2+/Fe2+ NRAMP family transporter